MIHHVSVSISLNHHKLNTYNQIRLSANYEIISIIFLNDKLTELNTYYKETNELLLIYICIYNTAVLINICRS